MKRPFDFSWPSCVFDTALIVACIVLGIVNDRSAFGVLGWVAALFWMARFYNILSALGTAIEMIRGIARHYGIDLDEKGGAE